MVLSVIMEKELTDIQKHICKAKGRCIVRACPGSGKTFTVSAKMAHLLNGWQYPNQGIAVVSFTNVAWEEIEKELKKSFSINTRIKNPHFLGTIDSFINQFIFFPYGHLILKCDSRPVLVGEPAYTWKSRKGDYFYNQFFDKISYNIENNLSKIAYIPFSLYEEDGSKNSRYNNVKRMKEKFWKMGYVNQSDANYFAMKLLEACPSIGKLLALRFPFIIIDEAQDTSEIQMKIIDLIVESGLKNIMLVGDPDQAIFEWHSANPELFNQKCDHSQWNCIPMNESLRSSQKICDFTYYLTELNEPSTSVNSEVSNYGYDPEIWDYNTNTANFNDELINPFLRICEEKEIPLNSSKIAILARSKSLINEINISRNENIENHSATMNKLDVWLQENFTKELAYSKYLYDRYEYQKSFKLLEKTYISLLKGYPVYSDYKLSEIVSKIGYFDLKKLIFNLIKLMPKTDVSIGEWKNRFNENLIHDNIFPDIDLEIKEEYQDLGFDDLFSYNVVDNEYPYDLSTIHKVKGETFEAVLLILKKRSTGAYYRKLLNKNHKTVNNEELRNIYVGITRPRKILVLAVPADDKEAWQDYFSKGAQRTLFDKF